MLKLFKIVRKLLPKISDTEMIALKSGTVSLDRHIFSNTVNTFDFQSLRNDRDLNIISSQINGLTLNVSEDPVFKQHFNDNLMENIKNTKAFSYIIDKKYDGLDLNIETQSNILTILTSYNPSLGVSVMVPNSLGPGELLQHYGTQKQKDKYLSRLASGEIIPCFGLTGPYNGSDAAGKIDTGKVIKKNGNKYIEVNVNKRYITMAPIANLIGLAFRLEDPENLLQNGQQGITVALLERGHPNLKQETYHNPLNVGFPNGTLKGKIEIPIEQVIGGEKNCGYGWKMLMECLAAGRGVSLPASALGTAWTIVYGVTGYSNVRKQFNIPISKMQGVQEKLANMIYQTFLIDSSVRLTNAILDCGQKPSVISAIMKQQSTERARQVLLDGMDVYAGSGICKGPNNFIEKFYQSAPIGITVEGSNTLTRSLIIFGQGLNKSHPYIGNIVESIQTNNLEDFQFYMKDMIFFALKSYFKSLLNLTNIRSNEENTIYKINTTFTHLVNVISLMGGQLKKKQIISGKMADLLSNLYLSYSLIYTFDKFDLDKNTKKICLKMLNNEMIDCLYEIKQLVPSYLKFMLWGHFNYCKVKITEKDIEYLSEITWKNEKINKYIQKQIYMTDVLKNIKLANKSDNNNLIDKIVQVGEYNIEK
jgi:acyl-CoA dehydrogenase